MSGKKQTHPVFNFKGNDVSSGGIIFYRVGENNIDLLLIENERSIEDLGGCTDNEDSDIYETVAREVEEESNNIFNKKNLIKRLKDPSTKFIYTKKSKYVIFILQATKEEKKLKKSDFGIKEIHDNIDRAVKWIPLEIFLDKDIINERLNWRLRNGILFKLLNEIKNEYFGANVFSKFAKIKRHSESNSSIASDISSSDSYSDVSDNNENTIDNSNTSESSNSSMSDTSNDSSNSSLSDTSNDSSSSDSEVEIKNKKYKFTKKQNLSSSDSDEDNDQF